MKLLDPLLFQELFYELSIVNVKIIQLISDIILGIY